jgi:hypothetical protein
METVRAREMRALMTMVAVLAAYVIPGSHAWSGPVLLTLTATHGVHLADLLVVALGLLVTLRAARYGLLTAPVSRSVRRSGQTAAAAAG